MCHSSSCAEKLISLYKSIQGCLKAISNEFQLTVPEMMIMFELYENKTLSLNELSEKMEFPKSSVSRIVDQLVNREFVTREIPKENRRTVKLSISDKCLNLIDVACINERFNDVVIGGIEQEKAKRMISSMEELSIILSEKSK